MQLLTILFRILFNAQVLVASIDRVLAILSDFSENFSWYVLLAVYSMCNGNVYIMCYFVS